MSFTSKIKTEISNQKYNKLEQLTLLSALIKNEPNKEIKLSHENKDVANLIFNLFEQNYNIIPKITVRKGYNYNKNFIYIIEIKEKQEQIKKDLSIDTNIPKEYLISDENLIRTYIKGVFLSKGSINDPKTSRYHLEIIAPNLEYAEFISKLLNNYNLNSKILKRENKYMVYIKESEKIGDFLRLINTTKALLYYEDIRIYRDHINMTNRLNNCEQANVDKVIQTATDQVKDIELIKKYGLELLTEKEQIAANYRLKYPETSLQELSEIMTIETGIPITKPGLHHRLTKIKQLANKIRTKEEQNDPNI